VLKDSRGRIIDGMHRKEADKNWPERVVESIKDEKTFLMARLNTNIQRRQVEPKEKRKMLKDLADETKWTAEEIAENTGMSVSWVRKYLDQEHKNAKMSKLASRKHELNKAAEIAERQCKCGSPMYQMYCCPDCSAMKPGDN
jgi:predicted transcriptional regulator